MEREPRHAGHLPLCRARHFTLAHPLRSVEYGGALVLEAPTWTALLEQAAKPLRLTLAGPGGFSVAFMPVLGGVAAMAEAGQARRPGTPLPAPVP